MLKVLLVEDSKSSMAAYSAMIRKNGYAVVTADSYESARKAARLAQPDIGVFDFHLGKKDGAVLAHDILQDQDVNNMACLVISGDLDKDYKKMKKVYRAGALDLVNKNIPQELFIIRLNAIAKTIELRNKVAELEDELANSKLQLEKTKILDGKETSNETEEPEEILFKGKVLLAEDSPILQIVNRKILEKYGVNVDVANNGEELLDLLSYVDYDLIITDLEMPKLDGVGATKAMRVDGDMTPVCALTGSEDKKVSETFLAAGGDCFLSKPIDQEELYKILEKYLKLVQIS